MWLGQIWTYFHGDSKRHLCSPRTNSQSDFEFLLLTNEAFTGFLNQWVAAQNRVASMCQRMARGPGPASGVRKCLGGGGLGSCRFLHCSYPVGVHPTALVLRGQLSWGPSVECCYLVCRATASLRFDPAVPPPCWLASQAKFEQVVLWSFAPFTNLAWLDLNSTATSEIAMPRVGSWAQIALQDRSYCCGIHSVLI